MSRASRFLILLLAALSLSLQTVVALAAPAGWKSVDVTLQSDQQQSMLLVSGELPPEAKLPAEAELAVPTGTQLQWIGEILGGDLSKDPELQYTKSTSEGNDIYRFTLTKARIAQVEGTVPNALSFDGTSYLTGLKWTAWQDVPEVRVSMRIPQAAQIVQAADGASLRPGQTGTGYSFYTKTVKAPKAGEVVDLSFSYSLPTAGATTAVGGTSSTDTLVLTIIMLVAVGGFGLLFVNVRKKMVAKAALIQPAPKTSSKQTGPTAHAEATKSGKKRPKGEPVVVAAPPKKMKPVIPMLIIIAVFVVGFAIAGAKGTSAAVVDGKISRNFGAASACQSASVTFVANQGVDLTQQGEKLLAGFEGMEGVGEVTVDLAQSKIDMAWCESSQSEDSMRQVLSMTGLINIGQGATVSTSAPASATVDVSGEKQTAAVDTSSGSFTPSQLVLKADIPAEISFGQAAGCLSEVIISDLGVNQDLTKGPATVKLPALKAGTYAFACGMGHQSGQLVVQ